MLGTAENFGWDQSSLSLLLGKAGAPLRVGCPPCQEVGSLWVLGAFALTLGSGVSPSLPLSLIENDLIAASLDPDIWEAFIRARSIPGVEETLGPGSLQRVHIPKSQFWSVGILERFLHGASFVKWNHNRCPPRVNLGVGRRQGSWKVLCEC